MSTTNYRNRQEKAKTYLYNISTAFDKLVIEREVKNTSLSKELIAKVKRTRKSQDNDHYIFYTLGKLNLLSEENIKILEKEPYFFDTLKIVMPIHAELGRKFFDQEVDSIKNDSDGNVCEKNELSTEESKNDNIKIHSEENLHFSPPSQEYSFLFLLLHYRLTYIKKFIYHYNASES